MNEIVWPQVPTNRASEDEDEDEDSCGLCGEAH